MKLRKLTATLLAITLSITSHSANSLSLDDVLTSVRTLYPPLLASYVQQDLANGRVRKAEGNFDPILSATLAAAPLNFYDGSYGELLFEQPLRSSGGSVYGGYRYGTGFQPDYKREIRTADGGEAVLGFRLPLLRDGSIDPRRAALSKAAIDRELADPLILKQYLDFHRAGRISYFSWVAAGKRLAVAEQVLRVAKDRDSSLAEQKAEGAIAPIVQIDNRRLVVSREIAVLKARRDFQAATIALSLFHRIPSTGEPIMALRSQLPNSFPEPYPIKKLTLINDRGRAAFKRPEVRLIDLKLAKNTVDLKLANNNMKPNLDFSAELNQALGRNRPEDIDSTEVTGFLKFSLPIGQNEARGRIEEANAIAAGLKQDRRFARERIIADANDSYSAVQAALEGLDQTRLNVELAIQLEEAENEKFAQGTADLLTLQIREQATLDAKLLEIDALFAYFKALADYQAAVAADAPQALIQGGD